MYPLTKPLIALQWRYNGRDGVSNHQPRDCLLNSFKAQTQETSKLRVTGLYHDNSFSMWQNSVQLACVQTFAYHI